MKKVKSELIINKIEDILNFSNANDLSGVLVLTQLMNELSQLGMLDHTNEELEKEITNFEIEAEKEQHLKRIKQAQDFLDRHMYSRSGAIEFVKKAKNNNYAYILAQTLENNKDACINHLLLDYTPESRDYLTEKLNKAVHDLVLYMNGEFR